MEITSQRAGDFVDVTVIGRLDGYWADHLTKGLEDIMRQGADRIRLNLSGVTYISSMGIRVLVQFHKKLHSIHGIFLVSSPSDPVKRVLSMTGLQDVLMPATSSRAQAVARQESIRRLDRRCDVISIPIPECRKPTTDEHRAAKPQTKPKSFAFSCVRVHLWFPAGFS